MEQVEQISPYYLFYIKGATEAKSNSNFKLRLAADYLEKALTFKETETAFNQLAIVYAKLNETKNYEKTILKAAESGFKLFYSSCGLFYANSKEENNEELALKWFNKGIEENDSKSFFDLAKLYMTGCNAFKADYSRAEILLQKGMSISDSKWKGYFAWALGLLCYEKKMYNVAASFYQKAIELGYMQATFYLALMYRDGVGVKKDPEKYMECIMMYLCPENAVEIASVYLLNQFSPPDEDIAFMYFQYAANKGHAVAAVMCAALLIDRKSSNENMINKYLEIAFKNGINNENLKDHFDEIEETLGEGVSAKLKALAEKYWSMRRSEA